MYYRWKRSNFIIERLRNNKSNLENLINYRLKIKIRVSFRKSNINSVINIKLDKIKKIN